MNYFVVYSTLCVLYVRSGICMDELSCCIMYTMPIIRRQYYLYICISFFYDILSIFYVQIILLYTVYYVGIGMFYLELACFLLKFKFMYLHKQYVLVHILFWYVSYWVLDGRNTYEQIKRNVLVEEILNTCVIFYFCVKGPYKQNIMSSCQSKGEFEIDSVLRPSGNF